MHRYTSRLYGAYLGMLLVVITGFLGNAWAQGRTADPNQPVSPLDRAVEELKTPASPPALASKSVGGTTLRLIDIAVDILIAAGGSTENNTTLEGLQGGNHDPRQNGFTLQAMEFSLIGAVDPYVRGEAHVLFFIDREGETRIELEEAFLITQTLPFGLQVEAGFFFTEFGAFNPTHPHIWDWVDQPVILSRVFGEDGLRQAGIRLGWLTPLPWFSQFHIGVQNAHGETALSFLANDEVFDERPIGGFAFVDQGVDGPDDLLYLLRWVNSWEHTDTVTSKLGVSALFGPNATGPDGRTIIYGADLKLTWRPVRNFRGWPFVRWQSEFVQRDYQVDGADTLHDWGLYTQILYGFVHRWAAGLRFEYATGSGTSLVDRSTDPFRDDRYRVAPLLVWYISEFARIRLQYNFDEAQHLDGDGQAHAVWLVFEGLFGAHPAHTY